jgi:glycosyltransferase involved in cell wall biosynthesis
LKVVHLSTYDATGGAGRAANRLHKGLRRIGHDSLMIVRESRSYDPGVMAFEPTTDLIHRIRHGLRRRRIDRELAEYPARPPDYELFSDDRSSYNGDLLAQIPPCDVINLHWIAGFVDYQSFFAKIPQVTPVVWTLHDMNAFTGGCHYDLGCDRHAKTCGACPQLGSSDPTDLTRQIWQRKKAAFGHVPSKRLHVVTPSQWLARKVRESGLGKSFSVSIVPYGIETEDFAPRDRHTARDFLGIPREAAVLLFLSEELDNRRKGFGLLAQALAGLNNLPDLFLLSVGHGTVSLDVKIPRLHFGHVNHDRVLSSVYSAADMYVIPSIQDNLPNTVLEAIACGTPVVGFDVGGIPDMVRPGVTGLLAPAGDVQGLRAAIAELLQNPERRAAMAVNCRRVAVDEYALEVQAKRYSQMYEAIVEEASCRLRETSRWRDLFARQTAP